MRRVGLIRIIGLYGQSRLDDPHPIELYSFGKTSPLSFLFLVMSLRKIRFMLVRVPSISDGIQAPDAG